MLALPDVYFWLYYHLATTKRLAATVFSLRYDDVSKPECGTEAVGTVTHLSATRRNQVHLSDTVWEKGNNTWPGPALH